MERKKYLDMCRCVAALDGGIEDIKNAPTELRVVYEGKEYYPLKYELSFDKSGAVIHTAVIHELRANAVAYVSLGRVEEKK